jgi:fatty acid desaturase
VSSELALGPDPSALRAEVLRSVDRQPDLAYGLYHLIVGYSQVIAMIVLFHWMPEGWAYRLAFFFAMGWVQYRLYFPLHEACHFTLFASPAANRMVGRVTSAMLFTSFSTFTWLHMEHHRLWGTREDPGSVDYYVHFRSRLQALRFFLQPFLCTILFEKAWEHVLSPLKRLLIDRDEEIIRQAKENSRRLRPNPGIDLIFGIGVQALLFLAMTGLGKHPLDYFLFYMLPLGTVFLFLARIRMYFDHGPLDYRVSDYEGENRRRIARSHERNGFDGRIFQFMNFRYHQEHHIFPALPSCRLREVHERFIRQHLHPDDFSPSYWHSLRMIEKLPNSGEAAPNGQTTRSPGSGAPIH